MVDSVEQIEVLVKNNTIKETATGIPKTSSAPINSAAQASGSSAYGGRFSTIVGRAPSFVPPGHTTLTDFSL